MTPGETLRQAIVEASSAQMAALAKVADECRAEVLLLKLRFLLEQHSRERDAKPNIYKTGDKDDR